MIESVGCTPIQTWGLIALGILLGATFGLLIMGLLIGAARDEAGKPDAPEKAREA